MSSVLQVKGLLQVMGSRWLMAGNRLGAAPAVEIRVVAGRATVPAGRVARGLDALDPDLGREFRLARVAGAGIAAVFARIVAAVLHRGRDLAVAIVPVAIVPGAIFPGADGPTVILVEAPFHAPAADVAAAAVLLLDAAVADGDGPAALAAVAGVRAVLVDRMTDLDRRCVAAVLAAHGHADRSGPVDGSRRVGEGRRARVHAVTVTPRTRRPGATRAESKVLANAALARLGLPVPRQVVARDAAAAVAAAAAIGYPVVVKPSGGSSGAGVAAGLVGDREVADAFARASVHGSAVVVEAMLPGRDHRLLVIAGRLVAATLRRPAAVEGDGRRSLRDLVQAANAAPSRAGPRAPLLPIRCDADTTALLARTGRTLDDVPPAGTVVVLHSRANHAMGSSPVDVTARVHPDNRRAACQAAVALGLDVAGVDFICPDIARSWCETGGGICEVNRQPGLVPHIVAEARMADATAPFVAHLLPGPDRIPVVAVLGEGDGADAAARALAAALAARGHAVGLADSGGLTAAGLPLADPGIGQPRRVRRLVDDPLVDAVVAAVPPAAILADGFGHGRADLAVVLAPPDDRVAAAAARVLAGIGAAVVPWPGMAGVDRLAARLAPLTCTRARR